MFSLRQILLSPFALIYGIITGIRNFCYDHDIFKSTAFDTPIISIGNLSTGGTGKTPMVEYLIQSLGHKYSIAVLSRGYRRKTSGFLWVEKTESPSKVGDEPLQLKTKFNEVIVAVSEDRVDGVQKICKKYPQINLILLDDAFQHRKIKPKVTLLLTTYNKPFVTDYLLPAGNLRESRLGMQRSDAIIVTKCPQNFEQIPIRHKPIFYAISSYQNPTVNQTVFGFSGLANNDIFKAHLKESYSLVGFKSYTDHHHFTQKDIDALINLAQNSVLICTEKDWIKVQHLTIKHPIEKVGISHQIQEEQKFNHWLLKQIES